MIIMLRALILATLVSIVPGPAVVQTTSVLHIKVVLLDAEQKAAPVPRHALLISDNPATAPPRKVVTAIDGTADVQLRPGNYTVESDQPVVFLGKAYGWTQMVDIVAGRDAVLQLTTDNAEVGPVTETMATAAANAEADISLHLPQWQDSVVALWSPTAHGTGFVFDAKGLVVTNQRIIGTATSVEVQLTPAIKVAGTVVAADSARDVAVLLIDPSVVTSIKPVPLGCGVARTPLLERQEIVTIGTPLRGQKRVTSASVSRVDAQSIESDLTLATGSSGGPVFGPGGVVVGITSFVDEKDERILGESRIIRIDDVCETVAAAEKKMKDATRPGSTHLPVEPALSFPVDTLKDTVERRLGNLNPYQMSSADYDVAFITPLLTYAAHYQAEQDRRRERSGGKHDSGSDAPVVKPMMDFGSWSDYVDDFPPVLLVRVTPKLVEGLWTKVARGAAQTQGVALPPMKRFKSGFSRMRAYCGDTEITPIHPFKLEQHVSETNTIVQGLYVFSPDALTPQCGTVKLVLYSEKEPEKGDSRVVDPKVVEQIWQDFALYRGTK